MTDLSFAISCKGQIEELNFFFDAFLPKNEKKVMFLGKKEMAFVAKLR